MAARTQNGKTDHVKQTEKLSPLITSAVALWYTSQQVAFWCQHVLIWILGVQVDSVKQPTKPRLCGFETRVSSSDVDHMSHLDHCFIMSTKMYKHRLRSVKVLRF